MGAKTDVIRVINEDIQKIHTRLTAVTVPVREDVLIRNGVIPSCECAIDNEDDASCANATVASAIWVSKHLKTDPAVRRYDDPSDFEMRQILSDSADYTDDWYHSVVTFHITEKDTFKVAPGLASEIVGLPESAGVMVRFAYDDEVINPFQLT